MYCKYKSSITYIKSYMEGILKGEVLNNKVNSCIYLYVDATYLVQAILGLDMHLHVPKSTEIFATAPRTK